MEVILLLPCNFKYLSDFWNFLQIGADGRRNQVFLALSTAAEFRDHLSLFSEFYSNLGKMVYFFYFSKII